MSNRGDYLGEMVIAWMPCGRVCASGWVDTDDDAARMMRDYTRPYVAKVERVQRYSNDPRPEWMKPGCRKCCTEAGE